MNILYIVFSFNVGGIEKLLVDILNEISLDSEKKIYMVIINDEYDYSLIEQISDRVQVILFNRKAGTRRINYILQFVKLIKKLKINVIHCQCINTVKFALLGKFLNKNVRLIHTVHATKIYSKLSKNEVIIDKIFVDKIIAISRAVKTDILDRGIRNNKIEIVYNAINLKRFEFNERNKIDRNSIVIGNVARLVPEIKGQDILIKAVSQLKKKYPNIKCLLAGAPPLGKEDNVEYLKELCRENNVSNNVEILGNINNIPKFLKTIDIFVMPSIYEGFGISLIEAMAIGVPCIASNIDGPKEIIKNNEYGILFESEDYADLAKKIESVINNYNDIDTVKINKYVVDNYDIKAMTKKLNTLYQK